MVDAARPLASMPATRLQAALQLRFCVLPKKDKIRCMDENTSQVTSNQRDLQALLESLNGGIPVHAAEVQRCERCAVSELPKCCRQKTELFPFLPSQLHLRGLPWLTQFTLCSPNRQRIVPQAQLVLREARLVRPGEHNW